MNVLVVAPRRPFGIAALLVAIPIALAACSTLPNSGPTATEISDNAKDPAKNTIGFRLVDVTPMTVGVTARALTPIIDPIFSKARSGSISRLGVGDVLNITLFTASGFGSAETMVTPSGTATQQLPPLTVDENGTIDVPYAGTITVTGDTPREAARIIENRLAGKLFEPRVIVNVGRDLVNTILLTGDIHAPGRYPVLSPDERVLDAIVSAGSSPHSDHDVFVTVTRQSHRTTLSLVDVEENGDDNFVVSPGDQIHLNYDPRTFLAFGATDRVSQIPFDKERVSLAEAIARIGGPADYRADPTAVYLFRYEPAAVAAALGLGARPDPVPVLYRIDMLSPQTYFEITKFPMRDKDLIYVANARSNKFYKFLGLLNSAFAPLGSVGSAKVATQ